MPIEVFRERKEIMTKRELKKIMTKHRSHQLLNEGVISLVHGLPEVALLSPLFFLPGDARDRSHPGEERGELPAEMPIEQDQHHRREGEDEEDHDADSPPVAGLPEVREEEIENGATSMVGSLEMLGRLSLVSHETGGIADCPPRRNCCEEPRAGGASQPHEKASSRDLGPTKPRHRECQNRPLMALLNDGRWDAPNRPEIDSRTRAETNVPELDADVGFRHP